MSRGLGGRVELGRALGRAGGHSDHGGGDAGAHGTTEELLALGGAATHLVAGSTGACHARAIRNDDTTDIILSFSSHTTIRHRNTSLDVLKINIRPRTRRTNNVRTLRHNSSSCTLLRVRASSWHTTQRIPCRPPHRRLISLSQLCLLLQQVLRKLLLDRLSRRLTARCSCLATLSHRFL